METSKYDLEKIKKQLRKYLGENRYQHTEGVMYMACALAFAHGADKSQALIAGLLHDCAKEIPDAKKIVLCKKYGLSVSPIERQNPALLHAKLGACFAKEKYGIYDKDVLSAIEYHTTGKPNMTLLEKVIFIADYIEPHRKELPNLEAVRRLAFKDIDSCMYQILNDALEYLRERPNTIDPLTEDAFIYYSNIYNAKERIN